MESGSKITMRVGANYTFNQNIVLQGPATLAMAESTSGHNTTRTFATAITGAFTLTILGNNGNTVNLNTANSFSSLNMTADDRYRLFLNAAGAAGTGDVTMRNRTSQEGMRGGSLVINSAANTIADTAKLTLNNIGYDGTTSDGAVPRAMVVMNENETVGSLEVNVPTTLNVTPQPTSLRFLSGDSTLKVNGTATFNGPSAAMQMFNTSALTVGDLTFNDNAGWEITGNTLTIDTSGGGTGEITTNVNATISSILAGSAPITKLGNGTLLLTNAGNTHSGGIDIQAGILALGATGSISNSASIDIGSGAELDTTAQAFTMLGDQPFTFDIDPTGVGLAGLLDAATLDITAGDVSFDLLGALDDPVYVFASYSSLLGASFSSVALPAGYAIDYNYQSGNVIALVQQAVVIPEPASIALWSLLGLGLVGCGFWRERRRK
jgi:autotransporter-associated beta strand protein